MVRRTCSGAKRGGVHVLYKKYMYMYTIHVHVTTIVKEHVLYVINTSSGKRIREEELLLS